MGGDWIASGGLVDWGTKPSMGFASCLRSGFFSWAVYVNVKIETMCGIDVMAAYHIEEREIEHFGHHFTVIIGPCELHY